MKKIISLSLLIFLFSITGLFAQKEFNGSITYKLTLEGENLNPQMIAMMPDMLTYNIKGAKMQTEMQMSVGNITSISDAERDEMYVVSEFQGQKNVQHMTKEMLEEERGTEQIIDVRLVNETKEIAGLQCKKAILTQEIDGEEIISILYYAPQYFSTAFNVQSKEMTKIPGIPMQFEQQMEGAVMKMEAIKVVKKKLPNSLFEIPAQ